MVKAVSGLLRPGWAARLLAAAAMATAARVQLAWLWTSVIGTGSDLVTPAVGIPAAVWCLVVVVASVCAVIDESGAAASAERRWVTGKAPFILWGCLTRDGRVAVWMALLWILLWPAELLACLWVALWWLCAALGAAMDFTVCRRKGPLEGKR
jgi:hypothetical protein